MDKNRAPKRLSYAPPKWMFENYEKMDADIAEDIHSAIYYMRADQLGLEELPEDEVLHARLIAETVMASVLQADTISEASGRAFLRQLWETQKNGYYHLAPEEYATMQEWLIDKIPRLKPSSGELYDTLYLLEHVFPMLEKIGNNWDPQKLLSFRENWSKTRATLPFFHKITKDMNMTLKDIDQRIDKIKVELAVNLNKIEELEGEEHELMQQKIDEVKEELVIFTKEKAETEKEVIEKWKHGVDKALSVIVDPTIPAGDNHAIRTALYGAEAMKASFTGMKTLTNDGKTMYFFEIDGSYDRTIEKSLATIIDFEMTDMIVIRDTINKRFKKG